MDDVPLCPPWWPSMIWWLIHHHGPGPDPGPVDREAFKRLDAHFAGLAVEALAGRLDDAKVGREIDGLVNRLKSDPMPAIAALGGFATAGR